MVVAGKDCQSLSGWPAKAERLVMPVYDLQKPTSLSNSDSYIDPFCIF